jgi:hypothetical protein
VSKKQYSIEHLQKSLDYLKKKGAQSVTVSVDEMSRVLLGHYDSTMQRTHSVTVFSNDLTKTPEVIKTENLE